ncbi:MAG: ribonucleotide-diphosphate reductase subunit beta [Patescibacteria group bacterium]
MSSSNVLLTRNPHKYVVFADDATVNHKVLELCDLQESNIWLASDINLTHDARDWDKLNEAERNYLKQILAFFASSDGIVDENIALNFIRDVQVPEVRYFYYFQGMMEAVHAKVYSQMINTFITSKAERDELFDSINTHPIIKKKGEWAFKWMERDGVTFSERLIAFMAVEGIFFAGSFASIFWIRDRGILANSLGVANEYISRDETLHADFAVTLYKEYCNDLSEERIKEIVLSALELETEFTKQALPDRLFGMNQELMIQYLQYVTDTWLTALGCNKVFNVEQPFQFMQTIGQKRKDLFFEKTRTNYARQTETKALDFSAISF